MGDIDGATVWQGTAFQCNNIVLLHRHFRGSIQICNNGPGEIVAQALGVVNDRYISLLSVTVSLELNNTTVECWHDTGATATLIRSIQIIVLAIGKQQ